MVASPKSQRQHHHDSHNHSHYRCVIRIPHHPLVTLTRTERYTIGANSGVGFATAKVLVCSSDAVHVILASRSLDKAEAARIKIEALNPKGRLSTVLLDFTDKTSIEEAAKYVQQQYGRLDVLMNNAGVGGMNIEDVYTQFRTVIDTTSSDPPW